MKRNLLSIMLVLALVFAVTMPVMAQEGEQETTTPKEYAEAADNTKEDSYITKPNPSITYDNAHNITMTYNSAKLKVVEKNTDIGRNVDAAWIGYVLTAPKDATKYKATYNGKTKTETISNGKVEDFVAVTKEKLETVTKNNKSLVYTITYEWQKDKAAVAAAQDDDSEEESTETILTQKLNVVIKPEGVILKDKENKEELWNNDTYKEVKPAKTTTTNKTTKKKDDTPTMGTENVYAIAGLVAVVTLAGAVVLNKRK